MTSVTSKDGFWQIFVAVMLFVGTVWLAIGLASGITVFVVCPGLVGLALAGFGVWRIRGRARGGSGRPL